MNESNEIKAVTLSMNELTPAREELRLLAAKARAVDITSPEAVHSTRIQLRDTRIELTKRGKELRDGALKFQKEVIAREKELVAIIEPEEERLSRIEDEHKLKAEMEKRKEELQSRIDALVAIGDEEPVDEEALLKMDDNEFNAYRLERIEKELMRKEEVRQAEQRAKDEAEAAKRVEEERLERERRAEEDKKAAEARRAEEEKLAAERKALEDEKRKLEEEKRIAEAKEQARKEAEAAAQREIERKEREAKLEKEKVERDAEEKAKAETERLKGEKLQKWLADIGFDAERGDVTKVDAEGNVTAYRFVGTYYKDEAKNK